LAMSLTTPDKIRTFQRKLYCKAKAEPAFRFYVLYDKICREDILHHAYRLARANAGAPGVDEVIFAQIEERGLEAWATAEHGIAHPKPARSAVAIIRQVAGSAAKRTQPNGSILLKMTQADIAGGAWRYPRLPLRRASMAGAQARCTSDEGSAWAIRDLLSFLGYSAVYPARWRERRR
jgi:hypothetical protein